MSSPEPPTDERAAARLRAQRLLAGLAAALLIGEGVLTLAGVIPGLATNPADTSRAFERTVAVLEIAAGAALLSLRVRKYAAIAIATVALCVLLGPRFISHPLRQWGEPFLYLALSGAFLWLEPRVFPDSRA